MTRLGDRTFTNGWLPQDKIERAVQSIKQFVSLARFRGIHRILGVATSAVREASNGGRLVDRILKETGVKVQTITGEEEARLIYLAVRHTVDLSRRRGLILDIGGGSVEIIVGDQRKAEFVRCLKLGSTRLADLFVSEAPVSKRDHERLHEHLRKALRDTVAEIRPLKPELVVGTSGTLLNLANIIHHRRRGGPMTQVVGFSISTDDLRDLHRDLARASDEELERMAGIDPERRDTLLPGACLALHLMDEMDIQELTLSDRAIREGILFDYIERNSKEIEQEQQIPSVRRRSVLRFAARCAAEEDHARQAASLSLKMYRAFGMGKGLHPNAEELLEFGALVHDIGYHVSYRKHHKHAYYLIKNADLNGFSPEEVDIIACVARFHRKRAPKKNDAALKALNARERRTVRVLSAILRVADALDRSHFGIVKDLKVARRQGVVQLRLFASGDPAIEMWSADQRKKLLEKVIGSPIRITV